MKMFKQLVLLDLKSLIKAAVILIFHRFAQAVGQYKIFGSWDWKVLIKKLC